MSKRLLKLIAIGFVLGILIEISISLLTNPGFTLASSKLVERLGSYRAAVALTLLASGLYGSVCMGGMELYGIERWPLALCTAVHWLLLLVPFYLLSKLLYWFPGGSPDFLIVVGIQFVGFVLIWLIMYLRCRRQIRELNDLQNKRKNEKEEQQ